MGIKSLIFVLSDICLLTYFAYLDKYCCCPSIYTHSIKVLNAEIVDGKIVDGQWWLGGRGLIYINTHECPQIKRI